MDKFEFRMPNIMPGKKSLKFLGLVVLVVLGVFLICQGVRLLINYPILSALDNARQFDPKQVGKNKDLATINNVVELPTDQNGTVGVIKDVNALAKKKDYFKKARNGDIIVIYPDLSIIYDPDNHYIVDISKINLLQ